MRICRVQVENYRNLRKVDVQLGNIVTLIGENNSGKSNFLRAISIPLASDDSGLNKRLSWFDINKESKAEYYAFLKDNRDSIIDRSMTEQEFRNAVPVVRITLYFKPENTEHYDVKDVLFDESEWLGAIQYRFFVKKPAELLDRVRSVLAAESDESHIQMSLLPIELFDYSIKVPEKERNIPYDTLSKFRSVDLPAERDNFASNADRLGSRALSDLLQKGLTADAQVKIEKAYSEFFEIIKSEGKLDSVLNWQGYSEIPNAQEFFKQISVLPNMPQMSSILNSIRLGYEEENMYLQGLGHRNLILLTVLLNSYINRERDISFRLMTVEEPEAHLSISNILLMASFFDFFSEKNKYTQIVFSTHNVEFVNKIGLDSVIVFHNGEAISLKTELTAEERDYLSANPNTDIFNLLYSKKVILVEGITEELLIKSYLQAKSELHDIKVLSFHKGYTKVIDIWKKINSNSGNRLGVVRDYDDQPKAQKEHEKRQDANVIVRTTQGYTLETDITNANYAILKDVYGLEYGWCDLSVDEIQKDWREKKSDVMLRICHDLISGGLQDFSLPQHIQDIIGFMQGAAHDS